MPSELLLLSGGIDSVAIAAWRRPKINLTIDYGQKPATAEITAAEQVCIELELQHLVLRAPISSLGFGDLAGSRSSPHSMHSEFWPYRNQYLITLAGAVALHQGCDTILIGTVITDSRHNDGSPEFLSKISELMQMQEGGVQVSAPAAALSSIELVHTSRVAAATLGWSHSCHAGNLACNYCRGCQKHSEVMTALGIER